MQSDVVENIKLYSQHAQDLQLLVQSGYAVQREMDAVLAAAGQRIEQEQKRDAAEIESLRKQLADPARAEAVKRILRTQIEDLHGRSYPVLDAERAAYRELRAEYERIVADGIRLKYSAQEVYDALKKQLSELRSAVLKSGGSIDLLKNPYGCDKNLKLFEEKYGPIAR